jgi:hypothetical protein
MPWEALGWSGLAALAPSLANLVWPRWRPARPDLRALLISAAPWLHGLGPAYLALITGAILERNAGLRGFSSVAWFAGGAFALAFSAAWAALYVRILGIKAEPAWLLDEPRFALYRATGVLWLGAVYPGLLLGLGFALSEWLLKWRDKAVRREPRAIVSLFPLAGSTIVFAITRNFFITLFAQSAVLLISRRLVGSQQ